MNTGTYPRATALLLGMGILSFAWWIGAGVPPAFARNPTVRKDGPTQTIKVADILRNPSDRTPPVGKHAPAVVHVTLTSKELVGVLDPASGTNYRYWTFDGKVPSDAGIVKVNARVSGQFTRMDHAISRMEKSDLAFLDVKDPDKIPLMHAGPVTPKASGVMASHVAPGCTAGAQQSYYRSFREHNADMADVQPSWMGPLIQSDARLGQAIRFSVSDAAFPGEQTLNYGNNHGISVIAGRRFQFDLDPPSFFRNHSSAHKDGFGNAGTQLKWRIASGNAEHGNYAVSAIIYYAFAPRVYQNQMLTSFYAPAVAAGRGFGRFAVMSKFGGILPTGEIAQQGRGIEWDVTAQVHSTSVMRSFA